MIVQPDFSKAVEINGRLVIQPGEHDAPHWKNTFNSEHRSWGYITYAQEAAFSARYPFFTWNGRVYWSLTCANTGVLESDL